MDADRPTDVLTEQQRYYCERAPEYDQWWLRRGPYDLGEEGNAAWWREVEALERAFDDAPLEGEVLELAGGTGIWTQRLAARASSLTVIDGSAEMCALNRARLQQLGLADRVQYQQRDLFSWRPERTWDAVFFSYFVSHVPLGRLDPFLDAVQAAVRPGGTVALLDGLRHGGSSGARVDDQLETRALLDGRRFTIVKYFHEPAALAARMRRHQLEVAVRTTPRFFYYGLGQRRG